MKQWTRSLLRCWPSMVVAGLLTVSGTAHADLPNPAVYFGLSGGGVFPSDQWDLNEVDSLDNPVAPGTTGNLKLRLGVQPAWWLGIEATGGWGVQHGTVLANFADNILNGTPLIAPGSDGINGVTLANAILLSSWLGKEVELPLDEDLYLAELNKRIAEEGKYPTR